MALHSYIERDSGRSLTVVLTDGTVQAITDEHPGFESILAAVKDGTPDAKIKSMLDPATYVASRATKVSERVSLAGGTLLFDGDPVEGPLADFILAIASQSDNADSYSAWVKFMEKLATNPSAESREHLFHFINANGITVNVDGDLVLYKGVKADGGSIHEGPGIVDGVQMNGSLPNEVGSVLEFPRSQVNSNRGVACATGLHAGTFTYASGFSQGRLLTVAVNPRDVVSVPEDSGNAKVRVSRYVVLEVNEQESAYTTPVWGATDDEPEDDDFEDFSDTVDEFFDYDEDDFEAFEDDEPDEDEDEDAEDDSEFEARVQIALARIPHVLMGGYTGNLRTYVSKHITAAQRDAWREAINRIESV